MAIHDNHISSVSSVDEIHIEDCIIPVSRPKQYMLYRQDPIPSSLPSSPPPLRPSADPFYLFNSALAAFNSSLLFGFSNPSAFCGTYTPGLDSEEV